MLEEIVTEVFSKEFKFQSGLKYPAQKFIEDTKGRVNFSGTWTYYNYTGTGAIDDSDSSITVHQSRLDLDKFRIEITFSYHPSFPEIDRDYIRNKIINLGLTKELEDDKATV